MTTPADLVRQDTPNDDALARRAAVQYFLRTGEYDPKFPAWSGNIIDRETKAMADMPAGPGGGGEEAVWKDSCLSRIPGGALRGRMSRGYLAPPQSARSSGRRVLSRAG